MSDSTPAREVGENDPPPEIPDFDLIRPIGKGGFGRVWLATNRTTGHLRAVKVIALRRSGTTDPAGREITSITRLEATMGRQHPNLVNIYHVGKTADDLFYVMDPADDARGGPALADPEYRPASLLQRLADGPLEPEDCLRNARQLLAGLASLHGAGMVHRDVKPANCLKVDGELKLADFGLLTSADPQTSRVGTQQYMPPDGRMDTRADVYAAGLVIYEMVTGLPAESFPRLGRRATAVAENPILCVLTRLALGACQPDPQQRLADAGAMLAELAACDSGISESPTRVPRRVVVSAAAIAAMLLVGALISWLSRPPLVHVNFVTYPFEARIILDGEELRSPSDGVAYTTPCTVDNLTSRSHHVVFRHDRRRDLDMGIIDLGMHRQVVGRW